MPRTGKEVSEEIEVNQVIQQVLEDKEEVKVGNTKENQEKVKVEETTEAKPEINRSIEVKVEETLEAKAEMNQSRLRRRSSNRNYILFLEEEKKKLEGLLNSMEEDFRKRG